MTTKAKAPKAKASKAKSTKTKAPKAAAAPKGDRHAKREKALALREAGKTYKEIAEACGYANPGAAHNGVKRAQEAAAK